MVGCGYYQGAEGCETRWPDESRDWHAKCKRSFKAKNLPFESLWASDTGTRSATDQSQHKGSSSQRAAKKHRAEHSTPHGPAAVKAVNIRSQEGETVTVYSMARPLTAVPNDEQPVEPLVSRYATTFSDTPEDQLKRAASDTLYSCSEDVRLYEHKELNTTDLFVPRFYKRVFVITALWDYNYYHFLSDSMVRLIRNIKFLRGKVIGF